MNTDPHAAARRVIADDALAAAVNREAEQLADEQTDQDLARAVLLDAISQRLSHAAAEQVADCRQRGVPWQRIADAFGKSKSAVRHRFDPGTVASHRASMRRRRQQDRPDDTT